MASFYKNKQIQLFESDYQKQKVNIPTLLIQLTKADNIPQNFWNTFTAEFTIWNKQFAADFLRRGFPFSASERADYFRSFDDIFHDNPLMLIIMDTHLITESAVLQFLKQMAALEVPDLHVILMRDTASGLYHPNGTVFNKNLEHPYYFTPDEESAFYAENNLYPDERTLLHLRYFTDGWPAAAAAVVEMETLFGGLFFDSPDTYIPLWLEHFFFKQYTQAEMEKLVLLYLIDYFELELIQHLFKWRAETLEFFLLNSPIIRYHIKTKRYSYGNYATHLIRDHLIILSKKQKEEFYIQTGDWYQNHSCPIRAINCYQKAGDNRRMFSVMKQLTLPCTLETARCYAAAIEHTPSSFIKKHPYLYIIEIYILCTLYRYEDAYTACCNFISCYDTDTGIPDDLLPIISESYILHSYLSFVLFKNKEDILSSAARAVELFPDVSSMQFSKLQIYADVPVFNIPPPHHGTAQEYLQFHTEFSQLFSRITGASDCVWWTELPSAELDYYTRNFNEIEIKIRRTIQSALIDMRWDVVCSACFLRMRYNMAKGNYRKALDALHDIRCYAAEADYDEFFSMPALAESWLELKLGNKHKVTNWVRQEPLYRQTVKPWNYGRCDLLHCYYLLENGMYEMMLAYIETCMNLFTKRNYNILNIYLLIMKIIGRYKLNLYTDIVNLMESAYQCCAPHQIIMPFIEFGNHIRPVIRYCLDSGTCTIPSQWMLEIDKKAATYCTYLYNIRRESEQLQNTEKTPLKKLTTSEQKLLYYISHGSTNQQLCKTFFVSNTTIKGMTQRLFKKIDAINKADASRIAGKYHLDDLIEKP